MPGTDRPVYLQSQEEVDLWSTLDTSYRHEYDLRKINDLTNLGTLLIQHVNLSRAQMALSGRVPELDPDNLPTGRFQSRVLKPAEVKSYQEQVTNAGKEIREIEKTMGIDRKSRDQAGDEGVRSWLIGMKARAHRYGLHVSRRVTAYEEFVNELVWRLNLNLNGDAEDKHYESCDDAGIVKWAREETERLAEVDRKFAQDEGALVLGVAPAP
jgi:hypothetical protein